MPLLIESVVTLKYASVISLSLMVFLFPYEGAINFHSFLLYALC